MDFRNQRFLTDVLHEVMLLDGMATSHPRLTGAFPSGRHPPSFRLDLLQKGGCFLLHVPHINTLSMSVVSAELTIKHRPDLTCSAGAALICMLADIMGQTAISERHQFQM
ncbi:hypothetical protein QTP86_013299 [Hemibagrus guttatus]|nr:hypothetical protein QTP86_013299 [Hemibagrus guttatus]